MLKRISLLSLFIISFNTHAALVERLGGLAYYDTDTDLTWLADANFSQTSGYDTDGRMNWYQATEWVSGLNISGINGWRLPTTIDIGNDGPSYDLPYYQGSDNGYNIVTHSEMSNMFYNVLGNYAWLDIYENENGCVAPNYCLTNSGPFSNLLPDVYWSSTTDVISNDYAWTFHMDSGLQSTLVKNDYYDSFAWAVHDGDVGNLVSTVPLPPSLWLLVSGLAGFIGISKRRNCE